jgi:glyoxylase-like metal-dependent hydrolase (beta-lactamase superfamily II)
MIVETFSVGPLGCNCSILFDPTSKAALVIDPGGDFPVIRDRLEKLGAKVLSIIHTHTHIDHVGATAPLQKHTNAPARIHEEDRPLYELLPSQAALLRMPMPEPCELEGDLRDGLVLALPSAEVEVIHTPGHTPGSICFRTKTSEGAVVFTGDTLFRRSVGRTDLWGGDAAALRRSLKTRLLGLDPSTRVVPGHGPSTTIGDEVRANRFLR